MRCFGWLVTLLHISSKTADDIVENNDQEILSGLESETFGLHDIDYNKKSWQDQVKFFLIMLIWSIPKRCNLSIENLHIEIQFWYSFCRQNGLVVKAIDWKSIRLFTRGFKIHLRRFFNWFYGVIDSNLQFDFSNPSSNLGKNWYLENLSHHLLWKFRKKQNNLRKGYRQCDVLDS